MRRTGRTVAAALSSIALVGLIVFPAAAARTEKPELLAKKWLAITGKPLAATAGARIFERGGNAVDASCAMLAATSTMWDTLGWGGETQAIVWHPHEKRVIGVNALGVAPTGATAQFFRAQGLSQPPEYGPLAAVTPGTPGGLLVMLAEWGKLSLAEVLTPAIELADGYPIEAQLVGAIERQRRWLEQWPASKRLFFDAEGKAPAVGSLFRQPGLAKTLRRLVEAEQAALAAGKSRKEAILSAYELFYRGQLAKELVAAARAEGALWTEDDLARWQVKLEPTVSTTYRGVEVHKLTVWTQGPALLQALNLLENADLKPMGYNSARYVHTVAQAMHAAFADRDFYYGDPAFPPEEPVAGLLSKQYARKRFAELDPAKNRPELGPGDPYPFQGGTNPYLEALRSWPPAPGGDAPAKPPWQVSGLAPDAAFDERFSTAFRAGTTSVVAADAEGWVVSMTPSGGWIPAVVAGETGIGMSQRMQSFVVDPAENPFNVVEPGKRPRVTLTPTLALKDGVPWLASAVQGGDTQDQNLLQFFLAIHEFGLGVQEAAEAANFTTYQMIASLGPHVSKPGRLTLDQRTPPWVRDELRAMGYTLEFAERNSGPINAILIDRANGTLRGGSSNHGEDYGIGW